MATSAKPEQILKDLGKLWVELGRQDPNGVLRACAMTLVAVVEESDDTQHLGETIAALMHEHPSRAIVLRVRAGDNADLEARVFAQCWMPFGQRQQICCESVEIISSIHSLADAPAVIRGLIVADLPVVLYCPSQRLWQLEQFKELLPLATKLILDSYGKTSSLSVPEFLHSLPRVIAKPELRKADLAWSRLTPWRDSIARVFEDSSRREKLRDLEQIQVLYKAPDEPAAVYYLAAWFKHVLGRDIQLNIARGVGPELASVAKVSLLGPGLDVSLELVNSTTVQLRIGGSLEQVALFPSCSVYDALRQELPLAGKDPVFDEVLELTQELRGKL